MLLIGQTVFTPDSQVKGEGKGEGKAAVLGPRGPGFNDPGRVHDLQEMHETGVWLSAGRETQRTLLGTRSRASGLI